VKRTLTTLILLGAAPLAHAGGFEVAEQTTTASGTAGAGTARDGEAGAASTNPAATADGAGLRVGAGMVLARASIAADAMDGSWHATNDPSWQTPPSLAASYAQDRWAVGLALGVPFGSGVAWPATWAGRFESTSTQITILRAAPFAAWRAGRLRVAAGPHLDVGQMHVGRQLDFIDTQGNVAIDLHGVGVGVDASAFYAATPDLAIGLTYKSRTHLGLSGGANFTAPDAFAAKTPDQRATTSITLPDRITLGGRWRRDRLTALADAELTLWGTWNDLVVDFANASTPDVTQHNGWHATVALRGGVELAVARNLTVRGGAAWDPSPAPDSTLAPSSPDASRIAATIGATYAINPTLRLDAFAEHLTLLSRESTNMDAIAARYGGSAILLGIGLRMEPGAR
jgi:long-chain fatty acid transport protein